MGGFTTMQSVGAELDKDLRDMIAAGAIPGPRLITSLTAVTEATGTPEQIRAYVDRKKADGADLIKLFATASIRDGGKMTMTVEQIRATCGEANKLGLRTLVHAHASDGARAAVVAGCTSIEHGAFLDDATLQLMKDRGVYFDPEFPGAAQLPGEQAEVSGDRQLHRGGLRLHGKRPAAERPTCCAGRGGWA